MARQKDRVAEKTRERMCMQRQMREHAAQPVRRSSRVCVQWAISPGRHGRGVRPGGGQVPLEEPAPWPRREPSAAGLQQVLRLASSYPFRPSGRRSGSAGPPAFAHCRKQGACLLSWLPVQHLAQVLAQSREPWRRPPECGTSCFESSCDLLGFHKSTAPRRGDPSASAV